MTKELRTALERVRKHRSVIDVNDDGTHPLSPYWLGESIDYASLDADEEMLIEAFLAEHPAE